jgi:cellulose synthase (UDP-forming)
VSSFFVPEDDRRRRVRRLVFRAIAVATLGVGIYYIGWRYAFSLNRNALWFAIPLVVAETYSLVDTFLFVVQMWKPAWHEPPPPIQGANVDVYITTYKEPVDLVRLTVDAAKRIDWPHLQIYVLDDGARDAMKVMADEMGCGYITRGEAWEGKPRHAKAGNINNALTQTSGEFILTLDADQIPEPSFVQRCLGYFRAPELGFVQTPQRFYNIPPGDPFGSAAPLFYGPILQGKDGWNAAFFCGSNALLRREALIQLGVREYVDEMERRVEEAVSQIDRDVAAFAAATPAQREALVELRQGLEGAQRALERDEPLQSVADQVRGAIDAAQQTLAERDMAAIARDLEALAEDGEEGASAVRAFVDDQISRLAVEMTDRLPTRPGRMGVSPGAVEELSLARADEAIPVQAMATISITEDMATAMRLHALGWRSIFHPEILAHGLAPEDLRSALEQRRRWAQGTFEVFFRENPLFAEGLSLAQRLQYFTTIYSYLSGFFNLIYLLAPIVYLFTGIAPVSAWSTAFAVRLIPYLVLNQVLFRYVAWGIPVWRGEQYQLGLFPVWIEAFINVLLGAESQFVVTPKGRRSGKHPEAAWPQFLVAGLTALAVPYGLVSYAVGWNTQIAGIVANVFWGLYHIVMLSAVLRAAFYEPPADWEPSPPAYLFPDGYPTEPEPGQAGRERWAHTLRR